MLNGKPMPFIIVLVVALALTIFLGRGQYLPASRGETLLLQQGWKRLVV